MGLTAFWSGIIATFGVANIILVFGIWVYFNKFRL